MAPKASRAVYTQMLLSRFTLFCYIINDAPCALKKQTQPTLKKRAFFFFASRPCRSWQDNLALTSDRVLTYRTGRVGVCLIASMIYIALISVELFVPDWAEENKAEADANLAKDIYYNDDDEVCFVPLARTFLAGTQPAAWLLHAHVVWLRRRNCPFRSTSRFLDELL